MPYDQAKIPNVRNWAVRDYGNRRHLAADGGADRYGIRASAALNSEVRPSPGNHREGSKLGWEWIGHNQTNALRLTMDPAVGAPPGTCHDRPH